MCQRSRACYVTSCLAALATWIGACQLKQEAPIDAAAANYVRLAQTAKGNGASLSEIANVRREVLAADDRDDRRTFLLAQLRALDRRARFLAGERISLRDEAAAIGLEVPVFKVERLAALRQELELKLPGGGTLVERLAAHRRSAGLPRSALDRLANQLIADCRTRTPLPEGLADAGVNLRYVLDQPWPAFTSYAGKGKSLVEIRRDVAWVEDDLRTVLCHETYPGHHLQNLVWDNLRTTRGWIELSVVPAFTPLAATAERSAVAATSLVVPSSSRLPVSRILDELAPLALAVAVEAVDGTLARPRAIARLRDELLMPDAEGFLSFVEAQRSMAVAYATPMAEVRDWESYFALLQSPGRLVAGATQ